MDRYHILELIGEGQFGKVYKGRRKYNSQIVALKFIAKKGRTDKALADLRQEIVILNSLTECDYVIKMLDSFETKSEICVVTEYAQGELYEILEDDTTLPEATVRLIAIQLVKALQYLHANRIIHRDMKPQNILIGANGAVKLCDFGFARSMSANTSLLTSIRGTPLYMAPELVRDMPYNHTTDCWSLGVILYELFVGQPPFFTNSFYTLVHLIVDNPVKYPDNMSPHFKDFLQGLLQKSPSKRLTWPDLANHPFVTETPEEEALRCESVSKVSEQQKHYHWLVSQKQKETPRGRGEEEIKGFGGVKKPATASSILQQQAALQQQQLDRSRQSSTGSNSSTTSASGSSSQTARTASSLSASPPASSPTSFFAEAGSSHSRSRSVSAEFDVRQLPSLLAPQHAKALTNTLAQFNTLLTQAASSSTVPSPLITLFPQLLSEHVPAHLCALLTALKTNPTQYAPLTFESAFPTILQCLVNMVHPSGGRMVLTPLHFEESIIGGGSGAGRSLPSFEVQLRRNLAEKIVLNPQQNQGVNLFEIMSGVFRACVQSALSRNELPTVATTTVPAVSPVLANFVILYFQCTRSSSASAAGGFIEHMSRDHDLLQSLLVMLVHLAQNIPANDSGERAKTVGRLLFLLATLVGKIPSVTKTLVGRSVSIPSTGTTVIFDGSFVLRLLSDANLYVSCASAFLFAQLLTNPNARMEEIVKDPRNLLRVVHSKLMQNSSTQMPSNTGENLAASNHHGNQPIVTTTIISALEGTGLGYSLLGSCDGYLQIIQAILYFLNLQSNTPSMVLISPVVINPVIGFLTSSLWEGVLLKRFERMHAFKPLHPGTEASEVHRIIAGELSINGWIAFLTICLDLLKYTLKNNASATTAAAAGGATPTPAALNAQLDLLFSGMCDLLSPLRITNLYAWPDGCGGGNSGVGLLLKRVLNVLYIPFTASSTPAIPSTPASAPSTPAPGSNGGANTSANSSAAAVDGAMLARVQKLLFNQSLVKRLLVGLKHTESPTEMELPVGFLAQLCMRSPHFEKQLTEFQCLTTFSSKALLNPDARTVPLPNGQSASVIPSPALLKDAMHILTQLARSSADNYPAIRDGNFFGDFAKLLQHSDADVRAKTCNLLGNLCRHSAFFYPHLQTSPVLGLLIQAASDQNPAVRKWAAFALGNAVFHSAALASAVAPAIPALVAMLRPSEDDKSAANAAGVLTNLLRHGQFAEEMVRASAVETLVELVSSLYSHANPPSAAQVNCARSALFTLGQLAALDSAKALLKSKGLANKLQQVLQNAQDAKVRSYLQRLNSKSLLSSPTSSN